MINRNFLLSILLNSVLFSVFALISTAQASITVTRDTVGVAKIHATTNKELFFAFGFVQARDRILQMEILRQNSWGNLPDEHPKVIGDVQQGKRYSRNGKTAHRYPNLRENLSAELSKINNTKDEVNSKAALNCFAQGINYFRLSLSPTDKTRKFKILKKCGLETDPDKAFLKDRSNGNELTFINNTASQQMINFDEDNDWQAIDVLAVFQNRVMDEFSYRNTDMTNLQFLLNLITAHDNDFEKAGKLFNTVKWSLMANAKTTIPLPPKSEMRNQGLRDSVKAIAKTYHQNLVQSLKANSVNGCKIYDRGALIEQIANKLQFASNSTNSQFPQNASNWWMLAGASPSDTPYSGLAPGVQSILYNGPQTGANDPSNTYQIALKSDEGFQIAGNTFTGTFSFWQGHNGTMAFGLTAGNIDVADTFCVPVQKNKDGEWEYRYSSVQSGGMQINQRRKLAINSTATDNYNQLADLNNVSRHTLYNVEETGWPVVLIDTVDDKNGTAYIQRSNWQGLAAATMDSILQAYQQTTIKGWNKYLDTVAGNFNLSTAHQNGQISYRLTGKLPIKMGMEKSQDTAYGTLNPPDMKKDARYWNYFPTFDTRLPVPHAPEEAWDNDNDVHHSLKYTRNTGFIANWNQKPWTLMPDGDLYYDGYYPHDRVKFIINKLRAPKEGGWTLNKVLSMNSDLQRMDVNYFSYKLFLEKLRNWTDRDMSNDPALDTILDWSGYREAKPGSNDLTGRVHYGHILFYEFMEELNKEFRKIINPYGSKMRGFSKFLTVLFKLKQPKINGKQNRFDRFTVDTSQNMQLSSRVLLNWLHYYLNTENEMARKYTYDSAQDRLVSSTGEVYEILESALKNALKQVTRYPSFEISKLGIPKEAWMSSKFRTVMGFPTTLGPSDLQVSFRPGQLHINDFRNRGATNLIVSFKKDGSLDARNVTPPGIREYRGEVRHQKDGLVLNSKNADPTANQTYMFGLNTYRKMHEIHGKDYMRSKL